MERLYVKNGGEYFTRDHVQSYLKSDDGKKLAAAISQWANVEMDKADKIVKNGDEHHRGERQYVQQYIRKNELYVYLQELIDVLDPVISWVKFHLRFENSTQSTPVIFISYRRADERAMTGRIYDKLCSHFGVDSVFLDLSMPLGVDFRQYIQDAINKANVKLVVIGPQWLSVDKNGNRRINDPNDYVRVEIEAALRQNVPILPALIEGSTMPSESDLPHSLSALSYRNAVIVDSDLDFHNHMRRMITGLEQLM